MKGHVRKHGDGYQAIMYLGRGADGKPRWQVGAARRIFREVLASLERPKKAAGKRPYPFSRHFHDGDRGRCPRFYGALFRCCSRAQDGLWRRVRSPVGEKTTLGAREAHLLAVLARFFVVSNCPPARLFFMVFHCSLSSTATPRVNTLHFVASRIHL